MLGSAHGFGPAGAALLDVGRCFPGLEHAIDAALGFEVLCLLAEAHVARHDRKRETHWH